MQIIGGNQRVTALIMVGRGEEKIDVRYPNRKLTKKEVKEYTIISNTHAGEFDFDMIDLEFSDVINDIGFDVDGLDDWKIEMEANLSNEVKEDNYEIPEDIETDIVLGDLFKIGEHRLLCGDSTDSYQVAKLMNEEKSSMILTDPPYNVKVKNISGLGVVKHKEFAMASGDMSKNEFICFLSKCFSNLIKYSKNGSIHYIFMDWRHIYEILTAADLYTEFKQLCVWNKDNAGMGSFYRSKHELIFI